MGNMVEGAIVSVAEAMPEDKYSFAPTAGEFKGVRNFGQQLKHLASSNYEMASAILGEKPPVDKERNRSSSEFDSARQGEQTVAGKSVFLARWRSLWTVGRVPAHEWNCPASESIVGRAWSHFVRLQVLRKELRTELFQKLFTEVSMKLFQDGQICRSWLGCVFSLLLLVTPLAATPRPSAKGIVRDAIAQMGGDEKLRTLKNVRFQAIRHRNMLEQSERPEGPYIVEYHEVSELRDLEHGRFQQTESVRALTQSTGKQTTLVADGVACYEMNGQSMPASPEEVQVAEENLQLGPERILLTALDAADLRAESDTILQSVPQHVVAFTWKSSSVRIFLNSYTSLPTAVEWSSAYPNNMYWSAWGDVTTRVYYSAWWLMLGGIHYPLQWDYFRNNLPDQVLSVTSIEPNVDLPPDAFKISPESKAAFEKTAGQLLDDRATQLGTPGQPAVELAEGVVFIPGAWNATLVRQSDGVVILEAPISSSYSAKVIAEANRRWPGIPVKAVISTSDSWPHIAGVREYVAQEIPVYALDLNVPILSRLVSAPHTIIPDALTKAPKRADLRMVSGKTVVGEGANRLEIYPIRGETSERQMMVYFPKHKLLYGSDPFQRMEDGTYTFPQTVWELMHAVEREKLSVDTFFMMHIGPTPWSDLQKVVASAENVKPSH